MTVLRPITNSPVLRHKNTKFNLKSSELDLEKTSTFSVFLNYQTNRKVKILVVLVNRLRCPETLRLIRLLTILKRQVIPLVWVERKPIIHGGELGTMGP